ncbi:K02A2.6-like [Cordylochernes scorpioides]|uniref:K02A2.6-like n=1 Tax=Cordylochernes scorpioides TaxID=51811 RepID=A0ABY6LL26_9ARAC|nr:K02A2.6-like [Cordylochernes scorpioides]
MLAEEAKAVVDINTTKRLFSYKRLPYDVAVAPNKFQRIMEGLFSDLPDNGRQFVSGEFEQFTKMNGIRHTKTSPYNPSTNGLAERYVREFKNLLRKNNGKDDLETNLQSFLFAHTAFPQTVIKEFPGGTANGEKFKIKILEFNTKMGNPREVFHEAVRRQEQFTTGCEVHFRNYATGPKRKLSQSVVSTQHSVPTQKETPGYRDCWDLTIIARIQTAVKELLNSCRWPSIIEEDLCIPPEYITVSSGTLRACNLLPLEIAALVSPRSPSVRHILRSLAERFMIPHLDPRADPRHPETGAFTINLHPKSSVMGQAFRDYVDFNRWKSIAIIYSEQEDVDAGLLRVQQILQHGSRMKEAEAALNLDSPSINIRLCHLTPEQSLEKFLKSLKKENNFVVDIPVEQVPDFLRAELPSSFGCKSGFHPSAVIAAALMAILAIVQPLHYRPPSVIAATVRSESPRSARSSTEHWSRRSQDFCQEY